MPLALPAVLPPALLSSPLAPVGPPGGVVLTDPVLPMAPALPLELPMVPVLLPALPAVVSVLPEPEVIPVLPDEVPDLADLPAGPEAPAIDELSVELEAGTVLLVDVLPLAAASSRFWHALRVSAAAAARIRTDQRVRVGMLIQ